MRPTHRKAPSRKGSYPDMRRIVRRNLKYGAEILELTWRETKMKPRPLVIICDISGSMSLYSRLLLHFIHTISNGLMNVEAFVFGTRLTRVTWQLKKRDVRSEEHTSELQSPCNLVCRLLLEKKNHHTRLENR